MSFLTLRWQPRRGLRSWSETLLCSFWLSVHAAHGITAQEITRITDEPACSGCSITLTHTLSLGDPDGEGLLGPVQSIVTDSRARFYMHSVHDMGTVRVFDHAGQFLTAIGRRGNGPGEYRMINGIVIGPRDTLFLLDNGNRRMSVLSPTYELIRTHPMPVRLRDEPPRLVNMDQIIINGLRYTSADYGSPYHVVRSDGDSVTSFGYESTPLTPATVYYGVVRAIAPSRMRGRFWAASRNRYVIDLWDVSGERVTRLERAASWFEPHEQPIGIITPDDPPPVLLMSLHQDTSGNLWTFTAVPDPEWRKHLGRPIRDGTALVYEYEHSAVYDTRVEAIDPRSGQLITTQLFDGFLRTVIGGEMAFSFRTGEGGEQIYDIYRKELSMKR